MELDQSFNRRARGYDCPQCPATTDEPCRTPKGTRAAHSHHQRVKRAKAAYATAENDPSFDLRARKYACPFCGAGNNNEPCKTPHGKDAPHSHRERCAIARDHAVNGLLHAPMPGDLAAGYVRMAGTTAHVYVPARTDHIIIGHLEGP